jgi:hypothetical protein
MTERLQWLEDFRRRSAGAPPGAVALLREAVRTGEPRSVGGIEVPPEAAGVLLRWHDELAPDEQEQFAADCNADFRALARKCLVQAALSVLAQTLAGLLGAPASAVTEESLRQALKDGLTGDVSITALRPVTGQESD